MMKKWRCTVCGYIHTGEEPPEKCPVCGSIVSIKSLLLVIWQIIDPDMMNQTSPTRWAFLFVCLFMLAAAATAGYQGGKLVFKEDGEKR